MTLVSSWLLGALAIGSMLMCFFLWPVVHEEIKAEDAPLWRNRAFWLSGALLVHPIGAFLLIAATVVAGIENQVGLVVYLLWGAWLLWLVSKTMVLVSLGRFWFSCTMYALWTAAVLIWRFGL